MTYNRLFAGLLFLLLALPLAARDVSVKYRPTPVDVSSHLKLTDIDSERMVIQIELGKGARDRQAMLSPALLQLLRAWWREGRRLGKMLPNGWLFPGIDPVAPLSTRQLNRMCKAAAAAAELDKRISMHTLRHSFARRPENDHRALRPVHASLSYRRDRQ